MWIINPQEVVVELYTQQLPPEILVHSFINLDKKCLLNKLYDTPTMQLKSLAQMDWKVKQKISDVFAENN